MCRFRYFIERMLRLHIFYILLQAATSAMEYGYEGDLDNLPGSINWQMDGRRSKQQKFDKILSNIHSLFKERSSANNENSKSVDDYNDFNYNHNIEDKQQFDAVLSEVTSALDNIKEELLKFNNDGVLTVEAPAVKRERRYKRDVTNVTATNATTTEKDETVAATSTEKPIPVIDKVTLLRANNDTVKTEVLANNDTIDTIKNGRRKMPPWLKHPDYVGPTTSKIKDKLIPYLEDSFNEVEMKFKPLTNIKIALSNDDHYKIGYIIATIDTLEVNLKKLKNDMNLHQDIWDEEKIFELFDRIKTTNNVARSLIESLKKYLPSNRGFKL